jgi:NADH-quinone oxidoreductase subunit D
MLGIEVPERAVWIRMLLAELNRVLSHLMFLAALPPELADDPPLAAGIAAREAIQSVMEEATGGRMHFMFNQVGGVKAALPAAWPAHVRAAVADVRTAVAADLAPLFLDNTGLRDRARGVGVLDRATAESYGVSGPVARASGLDLDLRRDDPYLAYGDLPTELVRVVLRSEGDCLARYECLLEQIGVSLDLAGHCLSRLEDLGPGPVNVRLPKTVKAPEGETYAWTENPLGINGYFLVSRGERTPWRLKLRTASFNNVQALREILPGSHVTDLPPILCSMFFVTGDLDK